VKQYHFTIALTAEEFKLAYSGSVKNVIVQTIEGARVQIPVMRLQPFLLPGGVHGKFRLIIDQNNKFVRLERLQ
jgi:hypothetical protein